MSAAIYLRHGKSRASLLSARTLEEDWIAPELSIMMASMSRGVAGDPRLILERAARISIAASAAGQTAERHCYRRTT
jgi:hypothetical protein